MSQDTEARLSAALHDIADDRPYAPDLGRIEERGRRLRHRRLAWKATGCGAFAVAAIAAVAVAVNGSGAQAPAHEVAAPDPTAPRATASPAAQAPLLQLAGYLTTIKTQPGDAALILRDQKYSSGLRVKVYDLYADNGKYYFGKTEKAVSAAVQGGHTEAGSEFRGEIAAAEYAATGDLKVAREKMADAVDPKSKSTKKDPGPGVVPSIPVPESSLKKLPTKVQKKLISGWQTNDVDNWVWENSTDALYAGAGNPKVRAGVLRLLSTLPEVKVTKTTTAGRPTLTLSAGSPALPAGYTENVIINASTGEPVQFFNVDHSIVVDYTVTRVTLADVAKGKF
jgi:hypothetical protein